MFQRTISRGWLPCIAMLCCLTAASLRAQPSGFTVTGSPAPERMTVREAWRMAESIAAKRAECDVMIGSGGSMLPLYPDRTVLVVEKQDMSQLRPGMTVVFIGDRGRPVAHVLVEKTFRGWRARGLANDENDDTLIRAHNYIGTVVRAFAPVIEDNAVPSTMGGG